MEFLHKFLPELVLPLNLVVLLLGLAVWRRQWRLVQVAGVLLYLSSNGGVSYALTRMAEQWAVALEPQSLPEADAIVVLSAGRMPVPGGVERYEWVEANRFQGGFDLYRAGRAPLLVFTGARILPDQERPNEGTVLAEEAVSRGVPPEAIMVTPYVFNTADEAREVATLLRARGLSSPRVLLVTSAFHMPRAVALFAHQGLTVHRYPVNFDGDRLALDWRLVVPHPNNLRQTHHALREGYGRAYYAVRAQLGI
jgi:uncharacterized SAM-binding protein YcdF (DUF218 family)